MFRKFTYLIIFEIIKINDSRKLDVMAISSDFLNYASLTDTIKKINRRINYKV